MTVLFSRENITAAAPLPVPESAKATDGIVNVYGVGQVSFLMRPWSGVITSFDYAIYFKPTKVSDQSAAKSWYSSPDTSLKLQGTVTVSGATSLDGFIASIPIPPGVELAYCRIYNNQGGVGEVAITVTKRSP